MQNELIEQAPGERDRSVRRNDLTLFAIEAGIAAVYVATNGRYGFHRDENKSPLKFRHSMDSPLLEPPAGMACPT